MEDNKILSNHLVVCDCDGTLLKASVGVPPVNTEAICAFNEAGGKFTIATGRTLPAVQRYLHQMGSFSAPVILCGGALIYDFEKDCPILERVLPRDSATVAVLQIINAFPAIGVDIAAGKKFFVVKNNEISHRHSSLDSLKYTLTDIDHVPDHWYKVLFHVAEEDIDRVEAFANSLELPGIYFVKTGPWYLEMMAEGVNKGSAIDYLMQYLNIPQQNLIAIGDYDNDIPMLTKASFAVCMGDAPDRVKVICDMVTKPCLEGGVAQFLDYFRNNACCFDK